jgi:hypothetical protein
MSGNSPAMRRVETRRSSTAEYSGEFSLEEERVARD